ncbi:MAG: glycosyl hydrolase family 32 [Bacteroidales bacterium]|nr:glycosyl hydrolase family 32 [Bacteroidales bacterium]
MIRRIFLKRTALAGLSGMLIPLISFPAHLKSGELLYNGIQLPKVWPPQNMDPDSYEPMPVPYLHHPPQVIPIDIGRQLFVDDFLIESTSLKREFHKAKKYEGNPVLKPETSLEKGDDGLPLACPKDGGVWWDPVDKIFKMWYEAGWIGTMAYATSADGLNWERPNLDIRPGTNQLLPGLLPDSTTVFLDHDALNPGERFKMFLRGPNFLGDSHGFSLVSADGIHWSEPVRSGYCGDRSTMFYNPFRKKWVYSIRSGGPLRSGHGRARYYHEHADFLKGAEWSNDDIVYWTGADRLDPPDPVIGDKAQLYNLSAVAYESLMLGFHQIHLGPDNNECQKQGIPKITELMLSYSCDGFHWHRPDREAFIPATRKPGEWERGYVQSVGGICTVVGDQLWFYYSGLRGDQDNHNPDGMKSGMYAHGSTGIAVLRRDGFASMSAKENGGTLTTRPVSFNGKYFFVNIDCPQGELKVEILNENNSVIIPFSADNCKPISADNTIQSVSWKNSKDLSALVGKRVRFRFHLKNGHLYSFWVSPDESGASYGYVAAGGPGFNGSKDELGITAYQKSFPMQIGGI